MEIKNYKKKPVVISAVQLDNNGMKVRDWIEANGGSANYISEDKVHVNTLEGTMVAKRFDYIIMGVNGEFYPCRADIFAKTYEECNEETNS